MRADDDGVIRVGAIADAVGVGFIPLTSGTRFYPFDDDAPLGVDIDDIAIALAREGRWGNHGRVVLSVAQHSLEVVRVGRRAIEAGPPIDTAERRDLLLWALLHDSAEALGLRDIGSPYKRRIAGLTVIEGRILKRVARRFDLSWPMPAIVHRWDEAVRAAEWKLVFGPPVPVDFGGDNAVHHDMTLLSVEQARHKFLNAFIAISMGRA